MGEVDPGGIPYFVRVMIRGRATAPGPAMQPSINSVVLSASLALPPSEPPRGLLFGAIGMYTSDEVYGEFDYIVIGAGSAGCVISNRLTADTRSKVLLLEAGGQDDYIWIHIPVGLFYTMGNPRTDWCFKTEPEAHVGNKRINYPRGRVLGGSSSINGMIYMRGQCANYDG
jgi:GMC oxidoreductase